MRAPATRDAYPLKSNANAYPANQIIGPLIKHVVEVVKIILVLTISYLKVIPYGI